MRISVLFGGMSAERDVSRASAAQVTRALREAGHDVVVMDTVLGFLTSEDERHQLFAEVAPLPPDTAMLTSLQSNSLRLVQMPHVQDVDLFFLALHGGTGENGTLQAVLDVAGIAYTGSGHAASANAMDKDTSKHLFLQAGIPTPEWLMSPVEKEEVVERLKLPVVVKPNKQGSTIGLTLVNGIDQLAAAITEAARYDDEVMIEQFVPGRELTVGILAGEPLPVGEIIPSTGSVFDYASKYQVNGAQEIFPAKMDNVDARRVQDLALRAHQALKLGDYSRIDFRMDETGGLWCLEANSLPGLTPTSLLPQAAAAAGIDFVELCSRICKLALNRYHSKSNNCQGS